MQPLSRVRSQDTNVVFGEQGTIASRPQLAIKIAECISEWANIESMLAICLGMLIRGEGRTVVAMYLALENRAAQLRALQAAAESKLSVEHCDVYMVVLDSVLRPVMHIRDKLAHWCWGYSPQLPNDLLLMEPHEKTPLHFEMHFGPDETEILDERRIYVITEKFLGETLRDIRNATDHLGSFMASIDHHRKSAVRDLALALLSNKPLIREGVARRRVNRGSLQKLFCNRPAKNVAAKSDQFSVDLSGPIYLLGLLCQGYNPRFPVKNRPETGKLGGARFLQP